MAFSEALKLKVSRQAHFSCCLCHKLGIEIHHIIPQSEGGKDKEENAAPLCPTCHETYGANKEKRKFIREARDFWYEKCSERYASDQNRFDKMTKIMENTATKTDIEKAVRKLEIVIQELRDKQGEKSDSESEIKQLQSIAESITTEGKIYSVLSRRRKIQLLQLIFSLPDKIKNQWGVLLKRAMENKLETLWFEELVEYAIIGKLEERISIEYSMKKKEFINYLNKLVRETLEKVLFEPDILLNGLTTADAERIQAQQAPPVLLEKWLNASIDDRPFLMAKWISEGKVKRIIFAPGKEKDSKTPGYFYMNKGRELLVNGKKKEAFRTIKMAFILDPFTAKEGFSIWLALSEESQMLIDDPDIIEFLNEVYGVETTALLRQSRGSLSKYLTHSAYAK